MEQTAIEAAVSDLEIWIDARMKRMKDAVDREGFLAEASKRLDWLWDNREAYDAKV